MTAWAKWGAAAPAEVEEPAPVGLVADRYCARCDRQTRWTNEHDQGLVIACTVCGLTGASELNDLEQDRLAAYAASPVRRRRRRWLLA